MNWNHQMVSLYLVKASKYTPRPRTNRPMAGEKSTGGYDRFANVQVEQVCTMPSSMGLVVKSSPQFMSTDVACRSSRVWSPAKGSPGEMWGGRPCSVQMLEGNCHWVNVDLRFAGLRQFAIAFSAFVPLLFFFHIANLWWNFIMFVC